VLNLGFTEILVISVVAILVFGPRLPQVAAEAAHFVGRMRRSLAELRRETGIDREIAEARRNLEQAVPRDVRTFDVRKTLRARSDELRREVAAPIEKSLSGPPPEEPEDRAQPGRADPPPEGVDPEARTERA